MEKTICELFAGVGGFRLGFENINRGWKTVWFNQWEPGKKKQWAHDCYVEHFGSLDDPNLAALTNVDIHIVDKDVIPHHTLLVGGFPCQDYSVAKSLCDSRGIEGKKGVLWWDIVDVIEKKNPDFCLFENVDRLLKSPKKQRGRDFGIILSCLNNHGYNTEWRVINAAEYGSSQRRRRTFIFCYKSTTRYAAIQNTIDPYESLTSKGMMARAFPVDRNNYAPRETIEIDEDLHEMTKKFKCDFLNAGVTRNDHVFTTNLKTNPKDKQDSLVTLRSILESDVDEHFYVREDMVSKWEAAKKRKKILRESNGFQYIFAEGALSFPDSLDKPGRTMLTSEGKVGRSSHIICDPETNRLRVLTPVECERLQSFPDNWTVSMPEGMRYFCMGNALVVTMIEKMAYEIDKIIQHED